MKSKFLARSRKMKSQVSFLKFEIEWPNRKKEAFRNHLGAILLLFILFFALILRRFSFSEEM